MTSSKRLIIHIGVHKTGSTAIQHYFWQHAEALQSHDILYPAAGRPKAANVALAHHDLAWALIGRIPESPHDILDRLRAEIDASPLGTVVLSSEEFDKCTPANIETIRQALPYPTEIVFYYRRQSEILQGMYGTDVAYHGERRDIRAYADHYQVTLDFLALAQEWAAAFGRERIVPLAYNPARFPNRDIVPAFLAAMGLAGPAPGKEAEEFQYNKSLPWHAVLSVLRLRRLMIPDTLLARVVNILGIVCRTESSSARFLPPSEAHAFDLRFADQNRQFLEAFCPQGEPITPTSAEGDDAFFDERSALRPDTQRTLLSVIAFIRNAENSRLAALELRRSARAENPAPPAGG